jgi:hypothetical protein
MTTQQQLIEALNSPEKAERLDALRRLKAQQTEAPKGSSSGIDQVNNHIHTTYSFSPYSPSKAVYTAWQSGLVTAGIMDHDSISGAEEFIEAGKIVGIATTIGFEHRVDMHNTPFEGRLMNNPDQRSCAYLVMHGIPHQHIGRVRDFIRPYREKRIERNRAMVARINQIPELSGIVLDFDKDVLPESMYHDGGGVTERHILFALAKKMTQSIGAGKPMVDFLKDKLNIPVTGGNLERLSDAGNPMYPFFLLNVLKGCLVERFYVNATAECSVPADFIKLGDEIGAIPTYSYLGDVANSVTGDKKDQTYEDSYLDELVEYLAKKGFKGMTYTPTRNTYAQITRLMTLCDKHGLFQISGEDINSPFQPFICEALEKPEFRHLITATWALIGHEKAATLRQEDGMFSSQTAAKMPELKKRIEYFAELGKKR